MPHVSGNVFFNHVPLVIHPNPITHRTASGTMAFAVSAVRLARTTAVHREYQIAISSDTALCSGAGCSRPLGAVLLAVNPACEFTLAANQLRITETQAVKSGHYDRARCLYKWSSLGLKAAPKGSKVTYTAWLSLPVVGPCSTLANVCADGARGCKFALADPRYDLCPAFTAAVE